MYKSRLAVQLSERVIIYEPSNSNDEMHYRICEKLNQALNCNLLVVTANNLILCMERRLQSLSFNGTVEREWILDGLITYIKVVGGPVGQECLIAGSFNKNLHTHCQAKIEPFSRILILYSCLFPKYIITIFTQYCISEAEVLFLF